MTPPLLSLRAGLYPYQIEDFKKIAPLNYGAIFFEMGLGKSIAAITMLETWYAHGRRRMVYVCPNPLTETICLEAQKWASPLRFRRFESSTRASRIRLIMSDEWDVLVVNYEALRSIAAIIISRNPQGSIFDESQALKNRGAQQTKSARALNASVKANGGSRIIMTGTPLAKNVLDLWSQIDVLSPGPLAEHPLGLGNYVAYERAVAFISRHPRIPQIKTYVFREEVVAQVTERLANFAVFRRSKDVLPDLPDQTFTTVPLTMGDTQRKIYNALRREMIAELSGSEVEPAIRAVLAQYDLPPFDPTAFTVSTQFAPVLTMRLAQVTSGFVKIDAGVEVALPGNVKLEWMRENLAALTDESDHRKVVVFCRFIFDVEALCKLCDELDIGYVRIDGQTSHDAGALVADFQTNPRKRAVIANVQVGGQGHTMTAANATVFYSNSYRHILREQAIKRTHRISQARPVTYYDLACASTVDYDILESLKSDRDLTFATLDELKAALVRRGDA